MTKLKSVEINCTTGEVIETPYTEAELQELVVLEAQWEAEAEARRNAKAAEEAAKAAAKQSALKGALWLVVILPKVVLVERLRLT